VESSSNWAKTISTSQTQERGKAKYTPIIYFARKNVNIKKHQNKFTNKEKERCKCMNAKRTGAQ
jgi:hypothetical protein